MIITLKSSFTFEFAIGGSLKSIIQADGSLPETSIRSIGVHICQALHYLHQQDIIFCDLNPDKVKKTKLIVIIKIKSTSFFVILIDYFRWLQYI